MGGEGDDVWFEIFGKIIGVGMKVLVCIFGFVMLILRFFGKEFYMVEEGLVVLVVGGVGLVVFFF